MRKAPKTQTLWNTLSKHLRTINPYCEKCGRTERLACHHLIRRSSSRAWHLFNPRNIVIVGGRCHDMADTNPIAFTNWLQEHLPDSWQWCCENANLITGKWRGQRHMKLVKRWLSVVTECDNMQEFRELPTWQEMYEDEL